MNTKNVSVFAQVAGLILLAAAPIGACAQLAYENIDGVGLVYDAVDNVYWTQNADITGDTFDFADAQTWAANLSYAGIGAGNWQLPNSTEFTYIFSQLPANGPDNTDKYGAQQFFGGGPNDYFSTVEPTYWTDADGTDFNFFYGFPGSFADSTLYSAWAVTSVPEPGVASLSLLALGLAGVKRRWSRK